MRVNFFEEYPEDGELERASLIDFPSTIFIAADSVAAYRRHRDELASINPDVESAYWPLLGESYWVSPFADGDELAALFEATHDLEDPVLLDLELPVKRPRQFLRNGTDFFRNRRIIREFIEEADTEIVTAEYPPLPVVDRLFEPLGIAYDATDLGHVRCPMYYTSILPEGLVEQVGDTVTAMARADGRVIVGLGTIATGVFDDEPILPPAGLERDLERMADAGIDEVGIFRLGGLDDAYYEVIQQFVE